MAVLKFRTFGGLLPAASERALPPENAGEADNLHAGTMEFRPVNAALEYPGVFSYENPRTIYRMERTAAGELNTDLSVGWLSYPIETSHARWPNNTDVTERTTVTAVDGSYAPRVIDATGEDRLLGVPQPAAPTVTLNEGNYFTEAEREDAIAALKASILATIRQQLSRAKVGAAYTSDTAEGYLETGPETGAQPSPQRYRVYAFDAREGAMTDAYVTGVDVADVKWVQATRKGTWLQADGTPAWMGAAGAWHLAISYHAYGIAYKLSAESTLATALDAIEYVDTDQAEEIAETVADLFDPQAKEAQGVIVPLKEAVSKLEAAMNTKAPGAQTAAEVSVTQAALLETAAKETWNALYRNAVPIDTSTGI